ncbi:MAG: Na+/H+ antiporter NhaC [Oscillospiraceae bacterium]|nr:Na+/H+ antiporter NhaC [Oscillospiraceae bacterium]
MTETKTLRKKFWCALAVILILAAVMCCAIILYDSAPHIPMLLGCAAAAVAALACGYRWQDVEDGMVHGITQSLGSLIILMLIGVLIGVWIQAGVVPAIIYYGLQLLSPRFFLVSTMLICSAISMAVGSWGTAGTIGLAFMGIAHALGIPPALTAGAIISGSYLGDKASPLSDSTNLASAVTGVDVFTNVRHMIPVAATAYALAAAFFTAVGFGYGGGTADLGEVQSLLAGLKQEFWISPLNFLPLVLLVACVLLKIPAIASIGIGIFSAALLGVFTQGSDLGGILGAGFSGYLCQTDNAALNALLSAGGLESMMYSVSMIVCAMMFGGIMEATGMMEALMAPLIRHLHRGASLVTATVFSCMLVNMILPEQYIAIAIPGRMYTQEYDRFQIHRKELTRALGAGGAATSALVPWNTCGVFMAGVLGVTAFQYAPWAIFNLLAPVTAIAFAWGSAALRKRQVDKPSKAAVPAQ